MKCLLLVSIMISSCGTVTQPTEKASELLIDVSNKVAVARQKALDEACRIFDKHVNEPLFEMEQAIRQILMKYRQVYDEDLVFNSMECKKKG